MRNRHARDLHLLAKRAAWLVAVLASGLTACGELLGTSDLLVHDKGKPFVFDGGQLPVPDGGGALPVPDGGVDLPSTPNADPLPKGSWNLTWEDNFDGTQLDNSKWDTQSDSYSDNCRGNTPDNKLEYNLPNNLTVGGGLLTITAQRQNYTSANGINYPWTSGLITTGHNCRAPPPNGVTVHAGEFISMRAKLPGALGMWPALWTWSDEVDAFEYHWDNPTILELTNHTGGGGADYYQAAFDVSQNWHYFGVYLGSSGTTWYLDGQAIYSGGSFASSGAAIIIDMAVNNAKYHPEPTVNSATMLVDSIRVYSAN